MLISRSSKPINIQLPTQKLWIDGSRFSSALGCGSCFNRELCGGLNTAAPIFDCLSLCCGKPKECDAVCRNKPEEFAERVREISGFDLQNVPRTIAPKAPVLPRVVPVIFHGHKRTRPFAGPGVVCLPLFAVIDFGCASTKAKSEQELFDQFQIQPGTKVILSGTSTDPALERWWSLGARRVDVIQALKKLNVEFVTSPNYSLFTDQPRWDNLHNMKRIALVHQEFQSVGMACALHLNGRTERDWERWEEFIGTRDEITHVSFEFGTGAGWPGRIDWYLDRLTRLHTVIKRPIHLVVRGGLLILPRLSAVFSEITFADTSIFQRAMHRKAAINKPNGRLAWHHAPTPRGEPIDHLLDHNWKVASNSYLDTLSGKPMRKVA
jgi:hypothetical protein